MIREVLQDAESRMRGAISSLEADLAVYRTGRASPHLLDKISVEMYGVEMPLNQMAVISVPEPQQLAIRPYDTKALSAIERAILKSDLGIMPNNDGKIIRLNLPRLSEERRRDLSRMVGKRVEEGKVAVRNVRRDALNDLRELEKDKLISEDDMFRGQDDLQELTDKYVKEIEVISEKKEAEIMEV
ncbi:MAG: ribosome recycling factor [Ardenticatenaceae bacterium]|nr:ribosome recycling factor [Anaerolineales bacterium]MCB8985640.1 ribosome recycling factor [Ardenticatenaceae bacterium]MCB8988649.1 ribosome recycling factor [Ardenticatenaceae bacterium]